MDSSSPPQDHLELRRVRTAADHDAVYALRYRAYHAAGSLPGNATGRFSDAFDDGDHVITFLVLRGGVPVASTRTLVARDGQMSALTSFAAFAPFMTHYHSRQVLVEANRFVIDPPHQSSLDVLYALMKANVLRCELEGADVFVAGIRAEHQAFYRRVLHMRVVSPPFRYPGLTVEMSLMEVDFPVHIPAVRLRSPRLAVTPGELEAFLRTDQFPVSLPDGHDPVHPEPVALPDGADSR
jgi:hypothetical protein